MPPAAHHTAVSTSGNPAATAGEITSPELCARMACASLRTPRTIGIRAAFVAGDKVYGGRELRRSIRQRGVGYALAVRANHTLTTGSGRTVTAAAAAGMIPGHA
jgi:hypothetical protein